METQTKFRHYRYNDDNGLLPTGGMTVAYRTLEPGKIVHAAAKCHPRDAFVKSQGRIKSAGRLLSKGAQVFTGTEEEFLNELDRSVSVYSSMMLMTYGVTLDRKFSGKRKHGDVVMISNDVAADIAAFDAENDFGLTASQSGLVGN